MSSSNFSLGQSKKLNNGLAQGSRKFDPASLEISNSHLQGVIKKIDTGKKMQRSGSQLNIKTIEIESPGDQPEKVDPGDDDDSLESEGSVKVIDMRDAASEDNQTGFIEYQDHNLDKIEEVKD